MASRQYWFPKHYADVVQRLRAPMGFAMAAAFAWLSAPVKWSLAVGLPVAVLGLLVRAWAAGHLAKNEKLAMSGPYGHVRNPLYVGTLMVALGLAIAGWRLGPALLFGGAFVLVYLPAIELEEQHLRKLFPEYEEYAERVPMLRPLWRRGVDAGDRFRFSLYVRNQEYQAAAGLAAGVALLLWKAGMLG